MSPNKILLISILLAAIAASALVAKIPDERGDWPTTILDGEILDGNTIRINANISTAMNVECFSIQLRMNGSEMATWNITFNKPNFFISNHSGYYVIDFHDLNHDGKLNSEEYFEVHAFNHLPSQTSFETILICRTGYSVMNLAVAHVET